MQADDLVRMANQIAQFFTPYPTDEAVAGVEEHLEKFWTPAMRKELAAICRGVMPSEHVPHALVVQAVRRLADGPHE
jgi:formate dehydrogenase subunit delta